MKKYVNGKIMDMTEADIARSKAHANKIRESRSNNAVYEKRIKDLEQLVEKLLTKESSEVVQEETEVVQEETEA